MTGRLTRAVATGVIALVATLPGQAHAATTRLRAVPAPVTQGSQVTFFGAGFCGDPSCPRVQVWLDSSSMVALGPVASDGSFRLSAVIRAIPGQYTVVARQGPNGPTASTGLLVLPGSASRSAPPPTAHPTTTGPRPTPTSTRSASPPAGPTTTASGPASSTAAPPGTGSAGTTPSSATSSSAEPGTSHPLAPWLAAAAAVAAAGLGAGLWWWRRRRTP